jgi:hypothetical protein
VDFRVGGEQLWTFSPPDLDTNWKSGTAPSTTLFAGVANDKRSVYKTHLGCMEIQSGTLKKQERSPKYEPAFDALKNAAE